VFRLLAPRNVYGAKNCIILFFGLICSSKAYRSVECWCGDNEGESGSSIFDGNIPVFAPNVMAKWLSLKFRSFSQSIHANSGTVLGGNSPAFRRMVCVEEEEFCLQQYFILWFLWVLTTCRGVCRV